MRLFVSALLLLYASGFAIAPQSLLLLDEQPDSSIVYSIDTIALGLSNTESRAIVNDSALLCTGPLATWATKSVALLIEPADGRSISGTILVNGTSYRFSGWSTTVRFPHNNTPPVITLYCDGRREFRFMWWDETN